MKQDKFIRQCGPFKVSSISQDGLGVRLVVYPAFPRYNLSEKAMANENTAPGWQTEPRWAIHREKGDGGGPGIFTALALATAFEAFLNQPYSADQVAAWKATLEEALKPATERNRKRMARRFQKLAAKHGSG